MALTKQGIPINFVKGVDTKSDSYQIPLGSFESRNNSVFDEQSALTKANGYKQLTVIPDDQAAYLTTFNGNLTSLGSSVQAYVPSSQTWVDKGSIKPISLSTIPAVRNTAYQNQSDVAVAANGLACVVYSEISTATGSPVPTHKYVVIDSTTSQNIVPETAIPSADATYGTPRVFLLDSWFVILYTTHPANYQLVALGISIANPSVVSAPITISSNYTPATTLAFDALVVGSNLYIAYHVSTGGGSVRVTYLPSSLSGPTFPQVFAGETGDKFSLAADGSTIYVSYHSTSTGDGYVLAVNQNLSIILPPTQFITSESVANLASTALNGSSTQIYEVNNSYAYDGSIPTNYIKKNTVDDMGIVGTAEVVVRSLGLASKALLESDIPYFLAIYQSDYQPTYYLVDILGQVISILASSNASSYYLTGLPSLLALGTKATTSYLFKESIQAVNKTQGIANPVGVYSQLGIKLASFDFAPAKVVSAEIGQNLNFTGGYLSMYDGVAPVEQGFFSYPEYVEVIPSGTGGSIAAQQNYYQVVYSWADNQGNVFKSAPSLPVSAVTTTGTSSVLLNIPTLRLSYKSAVTIEIYRWSVNQQSYYQVTSITNPLVNDPTVDYVSYTDTLADSAILGNSLIYTTGGVLEDIVPPATDTLTLFNNRIWLVDAEDRNLLWFSKPVFEATPVEFSDLLTLYVSPTTGSEGSTGPITAIAPMDDKLIVFKENALGYIQGVGPDVTGANNQYSDFTLITSTVGCTNQQSIVFTPDGLMFQSNKGIWLVSRNLSTQYIGVDVELYTDQGTVLSAENIPTKNEVRFMLSSGVTLRYDYYYKQWGTSDPVPAITSTIYQNLHTFIDRYHRVFQETPGQYLVGAQPVLMSFKTGWMNLAGLQGFERFYELYLLGKYKSAFKLKVDIAYNYNPSPSQSIIVSPSQTPVTWGSQPLWGSGPSWGNQSLPFEARVFPAIQKCESFQITVSELFDPQYGTVAGEGLSLSGMNLVVGMKKGYRVSSSKRSFG